MDINQLIDQLTKIRNEAGRIEVEVDPGDGEDYVVIDSLKTEINDDDGRIMSVTIKTGRSIGG